MVENRRSYLQLCATVTGELLSGYKGCPHVLFRRCPSRPPLADPRDHRHRPADGRARRDDREHRAPVRPARPRLLRRRPAVGDHGLCAGVRQPAAARRPHRRPLQPQVDVRRRPARLRRRVGPRRGRPELRPARGGPRAAGRLRRAARPCRPLAPGHDIHRPRRTRQGLRHLRRHRRRGRRHRPAARRRADRGARLALVPVRVDRLRGPGRDRRHPPAAPRSRDLAVTARPPRRAHRVGGPVRARVRPGARGVRRLGRSRHTRLPDRQRRPAGRLRRPAAPGGEPAATAAGGHRPRPRRLLPRDRNGQRRPLRASSCSSPSTCRTPRASRRSRPDSRSCR